MITIIKKALLLWILLLYKYYFEYYLYEGIGTSLTIIFIIHLGMKVLLANSHKLRVCWTNAWANSHLLVSPLITPSSSPSNNPI